MEQEKYLITKEEIRRELLEHMDFSRELSDEDIRDAIADRLRAREFGGRMNVYERARLGKELFYTIRGLDVLQELIEDSQVTEIMINGLEGIFVERAGRLFPWPFGFESAEKLQDVIQQIVAGCNRVVNETSPIVDARLENGSRVNVVLGPIALNGPVVTIRRFPEEPIGMDELLAMGSVSEEACGFLEKLVRARYNIFISGGTGSGKTTFLNALAGFIPSDERLITIEDSAELQIRGIPNLVRMETRNANVEGCRPITIRDLIKTSLRMRPEDFIQGGTATGQMLDFLAECIRYGISVCVAGATSSGKTTLLGWLLTTIPDKKRIYTIENGSRELALVRREDGRVMNSIIHTLTRDSENERQKVDQIALLDMALRFNPDVVVVGEMRGPEANAAQEAARTGMAVVTTIHSMSCDATYRRMVSLCKRAVDMSDETLLGFVTEAYPIVAFCKQLENKERRLMEIMECEILGDGTRRFRPLFQYRIQENRVENGSFVITGEHRQVNPISESLARRLMENGMPQTILERLTRMP